MNLNRNPYEGFKVSELKKIIKKAKQDFRLGGWDAPKGRDWDEHVDHIDQMCSEFGLVPGGDGYLIQR